jgi:hypothetical protein
MANNPQLIPINVDLQEVNLNVPILRQPKLSALIAAFLNPTKNLQTDISSNYLGGTTYAAWNTGVNYAIGDRVSFGTGQYECEKANLSHGTNLPSNPTYWNKITDDNIGLNERLNYNCQKMQLEYILNKRFNNITSILPPYGSGAGNIYIVTNPSQSTIAWIGKNNAISSYIKPLTAVNAYYLTDSLSSVGTSYNYTIYVPNYIYTALGSTKAIAIISLEVNKYNATGLTFNITHY